MIDSPTKPDRFGQFVGHVFRWTLWASAAYVAAAAVVVAVWRLDPAWVEAAAIGAAAGAAGLYVRVRLLMRMAVRGKPGLAPLSVLAQFAVLGAGLLAAALRAPAGFLAAGGGVVLGNVMILVVGLQQAADSKR